MHPVIFAFSVFLLLLFLTGMPVAFSLGAASVLTAIVYNLSLGILSSIMLDAINNWLWLSIPLFIFLGVLLNESGISERLIDFSDKLLGHVRGGLSHVNVLVSMMLAGMSGSIIGDAAGVGKILIPAMTKNGYSPGYSSAVTAIAACIAGIIPPSITAIIMGAVGQISILRLWLGGIIPGIIIGLSLIIGGYFISKKRGYGIIRKKATLPEIWTATKYAVPAFAIPFVILGGMRLGLFTPTEAAAAGILCAAIIGFFFLRQLDFKKIKLVAWDTGRTSGATMWVIVMGMTFGSVLSLCNADKLVHDVVLSMTQSKFVFLLGINVVLIILGMFMEMTVIILILVPITMPLTKAFGIDPIHYGVLFNVIVLLGATTPPYGMTAYVATDIAECSIEAYTRDGWQLWIGIVISFILISAFPQLSLWIPNMVMG